MESVRITFRKRSVAVCVNGKRTYNVQKGVSGCLCKSVRITFRKRSVAGCVNGKRTYNVQKAACGCLCNWNAYV